MDRAMQLDALLASYKANVSGPRLNILYRASTRDHHEAYQDVFRIHKTTLSKVVLHESADDFRRSLLGIVSGERADSIFFLVDDIVFTEPVNVEELAALATPFSIPSLRLGKNIVRSYTRTTTQQQPPLGILHVGGSKKIFSGDKLLTWQWSRGEIDWGYPLSLDGNLFMRSEIVDMLLISDFVSPNTLEDVLQHFNPLVENRLGLCFEKSRLVNLPINRVQTDIQNIHGSVHQDDLLARWHEGWRIDVDRLKGVRNISSHQELEVGFVPR